MRLKVQVPQAQLLVVDGESTDKTPLLAALHAKVIRSPKGRAQQLNTGARNSRTKWILFLHADTRLPKHFERAFQEAEAQHAQAGAFQLSIRGKHPLLPLLALGANLRSRWQGIALGDQACFIRRDIFLALGGFPSLPIMEDYAFALHLKAQKIPWLLVKQKVCTSGRRWDTNGFWHTWWLFRRFYHRFHHDPHFLLSKPAHYQDLR